MRWARPTWTAPPGIDGDDLDEFFFDLMVRNVAQSGAWWRNWAMRLRKWKRRIDQYNPVPRARANVAHHYDLSGELYDLFLDADRAVFLRLFHRPVG